MFTLILCLMILGCGKRDKEPTDNPVTKPTAEVTAKGELYCELEQPRYEKQGYVLSRCDGSGFTSLHSLNCKGVDLSVFSDEEGKLHRNPDHDCYIASKPEGERDNGAKSESSKDMWVMRMVAAWEHRDSDWINKSIEFGEKNKWVICEAIDTETYLSRCVLSAGLISLLYDMQKGLGFTLKKQSERVYPDYDALAKQTGKTKEEVMLLVNGSGSHGKGANLTTDLVPLNTGFRAHLDVIKLWLEGRVHGALKGADKERLRGYAERETMNAVYQAAFETYREGNFAKVNELLSDEKHWPVDKLPTKHANHCSEYIYQRDYKDGDQINKDWLPCLDDEDNKHPATEYGVAVYMMKAVSGELE